LSGYERSRETRAPTDTIQETMMSDDILLTRRAWLGRAMGAMGGGLALAALLPDTSAALTKPVSVTIYKDPMCGCCTKWVEHLRANGYATQVHDRSDMDALKDSLGVPKNLRSCHTAVAGRYVLEGHIPAADVKRLLESKTTTVIGLAVPDMPAGSPGMEMGGRVDKYDVIAFGAKGTTRVFARH
jgi:hypothetical protein